MGALRPLSGAASPAPLCTSCRPRGPLCMGLQAVGSSWGEKEPWDGSVCCYSGARTQSRLISRTQSCVRELFYKPFSAFKKENKSGI